MEAGKISKSFDQYGGFSIRRKAYFFSRIRNEVDVDNDWKT
jgi:hypothetical protein